ncbi:MAG: hypothetical protein Q4D04_12765 [Clostridia bacterium]|nr:hypothetical protein [Clostridia bacterium]
MKNIPVSMRVRRVVTALAIALYAAGLALMFFSIAAGLSLWFISTVMGLGFLYICRRREEMAAEEKLRGDKGGEESGL